MSKSTSWSSFLWCWRVAAQIFLRTSHYQHMQWKLLTLNRTHIHPLLIAQSQEQTVYLLKTHFKLNELVFGHEKSLVTLKHVTCCHHVWSQFQQEAPCTYRFQLEHWCRPLQSLPTSMPIWIKLQRWWVFSLQTMLLLVHRIQSSWCHMFACLCILWFHWWLSCACSAWPTLMA